MQGARKRKHYQNTLLTPSFHMLGMVSYQCAIVTLFVRRIVFEILHLQLYSDLDTGLGVTQSHRNRHVSIRHL